MATALYLPACASFLSPWHFLIGHTGQEAKLFLVAAAVAAAPASRAARGQCLAADLQEKRSRRLKSLLALGFAAALSVSQQPSRRLPRLHLFFTRT
jgi:hypothetical protein